MVYLKRAGAATHLIFNLTILARTCAHCSDRSRSSRPRALGSGNE